MFRPISAFCAKAAEKASGEKDKDKNDENDAPKDGKKASLKGAPAPCLMLSHENFMNASRHLQFSTQWIQHPTAKAKVVDQGDTADASVDLMLMDFMCFGCQGDVETNVAFAGSQATKVLNHAHDEMSPKRVEECYGIKSLDHFSEVLRRVKRKRFKRTS